MREKVSTLEVRRRLGDLLDRVALRHDEFVIERKGKALAALVPARKLEQMREIAREQALEFMRQQEAGSLSDREALNLALEAQRWARRTAKRRAQRK